MLDVFGQSKPPDEEPNGQYGWVAVFRPEGADQDIFAWSPGKMAGLWCRPATRAEEYLAGLVKKLQVSNAANGYPPIMRDLAQALRDIAEIAGVSEGVAGWHQNGDIASWDQFEVFREQIPDLLSKLPEEL